MIISGHRRLTREELFHRASKAATGFMSLGCREGDSIALCLRNDFPLFEASFGAALLGIYPVAVNWHYTVEEARYLIGDCRAKIIVVHADLLERFRDAFPSETPVFVVETPPEIRDAYGLAAESCTIPADIASWEAWLEGQTPWASQSIAMPSTMIYTSGTTGRPKGVCFARATPEQMASRMRIARRGYGFIDYAESPKQVIAVVTGPMYHSAPNGYAMHAVRLGATLILQPRFHAEHLLQMIERERVTHIHMVPVMFYRLLSLPVAHRVVYDLSSLRFVVHAAAPCPIAIKKAMIEWWGPVINEYYGGTETGIVTSCTTEEWIGHPGTVGRPIPEAEVRVVDPENKDMAAGEVGEIICRARSIADFTYYGDSAKRNEADRADLISLGDMGYFDSDGFLYVSDRSRDMIISGGVNIYSAEIEAELQRMPEVADCAVFGIPDEEFGEAVCAIIEPKDGTELTEAKINDFLQKNLARYKLPRRIEFRAQLPREDSGKIFKRKLRAPFWEHAGRRI